VISEKVCSSSLSTSSTVLGGVFCCADDLGFTVVIVCVLPPLEAGVDLAGISVRPSPFLSPSFGVASVEPITSYLTRAFLTTCPNLELPRINFAKCFEINREFHKIRLVKYEDKSPVKRLLM